MSTTFKDRRRAFIRETLEQYGPTTDKEVDGYTEAWIDARLSQREIEMIIASDQGAESIELAEQFGYSTATLARGALNRSLQRAGRGPAPSSRYTR